MELIKNSRNKTIFCILISLFLTIWILPIFRDGILEVMAKSGPLDGSWKIGLNWATINGLKFGRDIIFTYGPLYFLSDNSLLNISKPIFFVANTLSIILWLLTLFLLFRIILEKLDFKDLKNKIFSHIVILLILYAFLNVYIELPEILLLLAFLLLFDVLEKERVKHKEEVLWIILIGFILSVLSLIKFYYFVASVILIVLSFVIILIRRKWSILIALIGSFIIFLLSLWFILEKSIPVLFLYIKNGLIITFGYSENVQLYYEWWQGKSWLEGRFILLYAISIFIFWIGLFIFGIVKKEKHIIFYFLLSFPIILLIYKQGFTRMDHFHTQEYFRFLIFLLIFTFLLFGKRLWKIMPIFLILILLALPFKTTNDTFSLRSKISYNLNEISKAVTVISSNRYIENQNAEKEQVKDSFNSYKDAVKLINKSDTVDVFPWEIVVPYVFDLKWSPRPVFQSYTVYNEQLNIINAEHFKGKKAPSKIIYRLDSIDGRYPIFDEPLVFQELLKNYKFIYSNNDGIGVLEKKSVNDVNFKKSNVSDLDAKFNQVINVPDVKDEYLFCKINIKLNIFGRIRNFFYKGGYMWMKFYFEDNTKEPITKRIVRENGKYGFYISNYIENISDLRNVFQQQDTFKDSINKIKSIELITNSPASYNDNFNVEFYKLDYKKL